MQGDTGQATMRPQEPLTHEEMEPLWRRERQVTWLNVTAMGAFLLASATGYRDGTLAWFARPLLATMLALLLASAVLQFGARCPRCGVRLRSRILRMLPDKCVACGAAFPRPPSANG